MAMNIGRYYERDYFKFDYTKQKDILQKIRSDDKLDRYMTEFEGVEQGRSANLLQQKFKDYKDYIRFLKVESANTTIRLKTLYPGLLIGAGSSHECGIKHEFKLGLSFDYTTGLPYIPASSVKGVLRSVFPSKNDKYKSEKRELLQEYFTYHKIEEDIEEFEKRIFEKRKNIFFDAYIEDAENDKFLEEDFITPHGDNLFKDPVPLRFIKIASGVTINFQFGLEEKNREKVKALFQNILLDIGIGAKTNVGYGQFEEVEKG